MTEYRKNGKPRIIITMTPPYREEYLLILGMVSRAAVRRGKLIQSGILKTVAISALCQRYQASMCIPAHEPFIYNPHLQPNQGL